MRAEQQARDDRLRRDTADEMERRESAERRSREDYEARQVRVLIVQKVHPKYPEFSHHVTVRTDDSARREHRHLKSRPVGEWRRVPVAPSLSRILRSHLGQFGTGPDGRVFSGVQRGELASITYRRVWDKARHAALTSAEHRENCAAGSCPVVRSSPLARRVYDLRHACVSTWLNGGVPPAQVAEWAGHSVAVLLRVYAKCIDGQDELAKRRIEDALGEANDAQAAATDHGV